jgi:hypothetical protein
VTRVRLNNCRDKADGIDQVTGDWRITTSSGREVSTHAMVRKKNRGVEKIGRKHTGVEESDLEMRLN